MKASSNEALKRPCESCGGLSNAKCSFKMCYTCCLCNWALSDSSEECAVSTHKHTEEDVIAVLG